MKALKSKLLWIGLFVLAVLTLAVVVTLGTVIIANRITDQQTVLIAPEVLRPGRETLVRAIVRDVNSGAPMRGVTIAMQLAPRTGRAGLILFEGQTDDAGLAEARIVVPEGMTGEHRFVVETQFQGKSEKLDHVVQVRRDHRLLLSTDKPLYQPGQTIHIRSLALSVGDMAPAVREKVELIIEDPKGNKVYRVPPSRAYDYYTPEAEGMQRPQAMTVNE